MIGNSEAQREVRRIDAQMEQSRQFERDQQAREHARQEEAREQAGQGSQGIVVDHVDLWKRFFRSQTRRVFEDDDMIRIIARAGESRSSSSSSSSSSISSGSSSSAGIKEAKYEVGQTIDLNSFSDRQFQSGQRAIQKNPKTGEYLERDKGNNPHGGSYWKLKDKKGNRLATVSKDGKILRN